MRGRLCNAASLLDFMPDLLISEEWQRGIGTGVHTARRVQANSHRAEPSTTGCREEFLRPRLGRLGEHPGNVVEAVDACEVAIFLETLRSIAGLAEGFNDIGELGAK